MRGLLLLALAALPASAVDLENGKKVYGLKCAQCHGVDGTPYQMDRTQDPPAAKRDDDGRAVLDDKAAPAARFVLPRPRDFTAGMFKIRGTPSGEVPSDADLAGIVARGMPGTSMPAWKGELPDSDIRDVVAYVKSFSKRFAEEKPSAPLDLSGQVSTSEKSVEEGRKLFTENGCNACHGDSGRGSGPSAPTLQDDWGNPLPPANFHKPWTLRGGATPQDIFRTFMTGLNGTPMPAYKDVFDGMEKGREKAWHLANYIHSLGKGRPNSSQVLRGAFREKLPEGPLDPAWGERPPADFMLVGNVVAEPRQFTPSIDRVAGRAFYNGSELALLLEWDDRLKDEGDALEIQFPLKFAPPPGQTTEEEKPYFLHGDPARPVNLWRWEGKADKLTSLSAKGPKSVPVALPSDGIFVSSAAYEDGLWRLYIRRKLEVPDAAGLTIRPGLFVPAAFFAADGSNGDAGLKGSVSTWYYLLLEPPTGSMAYALPLLALLAGVGLEWWLLDRMRRRGG